MLEASEEYIYIGKQKYSIYLKREIYINLFIKKFRFHSRKNKKEHSCLKIEKKK